MNAAVGKALAQGVQLDAIALGHIRLKFQVHTLTRAEVGDGSIKAHRVRPNRKPQSHKIRWLQLQRRLGGYKASFQAQVGHLSAAQKPRREDNNLRSFFAPEAGAGRPIVAIRPGACARVENGFALLLHRATTLSSPLQGSQPLYRQSGAVP